MIFRAVVSGSHSLAMCYSLQDEKSWKIFVILFWRYEIFFVPLHHHLRLAEQSHRGPATGHSYGRGEGQTTIGAGPKLPSARSLFSSKALAPERAKKEKARRAKERAKRELKPNFQHLKTLRAMINYSITARAVNPNLFEINQAKTRIN